MASSINASTSGGGGVIVTSDATGNLNLQSGGSTVVAVTSAGATVTGLCSLNAGLAVTGLVDISAATSGQIQFPATQNASANANTLDDYEEGTWTPTINFSGGNGNLTYATRVGTYTKIGRCVTFIAQLVFGETTAVGYLDTISGLPFTSAFRSGGGVYIDNLSSLSGGAQWALFSDTSSSFVVYMSATGAATAILASSVPASSCNITVSGAYFI